MAVFTQQIAASGLTSQGENSPNNVDRAAVYGVVTLNPNPNMQIGSHANDSEWGYGIRFTNITIAQGTTITAASLILTAWETYSASPSVVKVWASADAADNSAALAAVSGDISYTTRARSTASAILDVSVLTLDQEKTWDITSIIQEIINRAGWSSGNALTMLMDTHADTTQGEWQSFWSYAGSTTKAPKISITYGDPAQSQMTGVILAVVR